MTEPVWKLYRHRVVFELTPWQPGFDMRGVRLLGTSDGEEHPAPGDWVARRTDDHSVKLLFTDWYLCLLDLEEADA
jgi:hypothetical protein